jgi:hypothetical protein
MSFTITADPRQRSHSWSPSTAGLVATFYGHFNSFHYYDFHPSSHNMYVDILITLISFLDILARFAIRMSSLQ